MNLGSLTKNADKLGYVAGLLMGNYGGLKNIELIIRNAARGNIHSPNLTSIRNWLGSNEFRNGLYAYLLGMGIDWVKPPVIGKYGKLVQKGAMNYLVAAGIVRLGISMTNHPNPDNPQGAGSYGYGY